MITLKPKSKPKPLFAKKLSEDAYRVILGRTNFPDQCYGYCVRCVQPTLALRFGRLPVSNLPVTIHVPFDVYSVVVIAADCMSTKNATSCLFLTRIVVDEAYAHAAINPDADPQKHAYWAQRSKFIFSLMPEMPTYCRHCHMSKKQHVGKIDGLRSCLFHPTVYSPKQRITELTA